MHVETKKKLIHVTDLNPIGAFQTSHQGSDIEHVSCILRAWTYGHGNKKGVIVSLSLCCLNISWECTMHIKLGESRSLNMASVTQYQITIRYNRARNNEAVKIHMKLYEFYYSISSSETKSWCNLHLRNRKHFPCLHRVISVNTSGNV